jgi:hypothetical protein
VVVSDRRRDEDEMTAAEREFVTVIQSELGHPVDVWLNESDGRPWLTVSLDVVRDGGGIAATWRLDFDGDTVCGGRSPAYLNWDDGVSADEAGINMTPPRGMPRTLGPPSELGRSAAAWLASVKHAE